MLEKVIAVLSEYPDRESFFRLIASFLPTMDEGYQLIKKAYDIAEEAFRDIVRDNGDQYFEHVRAVALILIVYLRILNEHLIVAALIHDIVEDIPEWTIKRVEREFGIEVARLMGWLTKPYKQFPDKIERDKVYHKRFEKAPREFFLIKLPDRLHNILTLWGIKKKDYQEKKTRKIEETKRYYLPFAEKHLILLHELEAAIERLENE